MSMCVWKNALRARGCSPFIQRRVGLCDERTAKTGGLLLVRRGTSNLGLERYRRDSEEGGCINGR